MAGRNGRSARVSVSSIAGSPSLIAGKPDLLGGRPIRQSLLAGEVPVGRLILLGVFAVVLLPICCWVFHLSAQHARRRGTLSHY